jgi:hypothetical protein
MQSYKPPKAVQAAARTGLRVRANMPPSRRGGTDVGVARARDLAGGKSIPLSTIKRMYSFFARHEGNKSTWGGEWTPHKIAWYLWGGDAGFAWVKSILARHERDGKG